MHPGRPRKSNVVRDKRGKSRGEPEVVHPETVAVRLRELRNCGLTHIGRADALDALSGFTLGILLKRYRLRSHGVTEAGCRGITEPQYEAGNAWAKLCHRHAAIMGYTLGPPKSPGFVMVGNGLSCADEPDEQAILEVRRKWSSCYNALTKAAQFRPTVVRDICYAVCVENRPVESLSGADLINLRIGLNALAEILGQRQRLDNRGKIVQWCGDIP